MKRAGGRRKQGRKNKKEGMVFFLVWENINYCVVVVWVVGLGVCRWPSVASGFEGYACAGFCSLSSLTYAVSLVLYLGDRWQQGGGEGVMEEGFYFSFRDVTGFKDRKSVKPHTS